MGQIPWTLGLGRGGCPCGTITICQLAGLPCQATVVASALSVQDARMTRCPGSFNEIIFDSVELGTLWLDFVVLADSNWISATFYGTLRCISEPCSDGGERGDDVSARCGPPATGAADGIYSLTAVKLIYPNTAQTMGGGKITLVSTCLGRALSAQPTSDSHFGNWGGSI